MVISALFQQLSSFSQRMKTSENSIVNNLDEVFTMMALNVVWQMAAGERFNYDQDEMVKLLQFMQFINEVFWSIFASLLTPMPFLRHFSPFKQRIEGANVKMGQLHDFYRANIKAHKKTFDPNNIRDVIDAFLLQIQNAEKDENTKKHFTDQHLLVVLSDLFLAGSETTGKAMEWACLFMILNPEVKLIF
jgi:cytochrome P450 family 2 subfamily J